MRVLVFWRAFRFTSSQHRPDPGNDLFYRERLDDIVVRPGVEPQDLIALGRLGSEHDNRRFFGQRLTPQTSAKLHPAHPRQHQVE